MSGKERITTPLFFTWNCGHGEAKYCSTEEAWIKTSFSCLKIPYTTSTLNCLPPFHHLVLLSVHIHQDVILEIQKEKKKKEEKTWQSLTMLSHLALCSLTTSFGSSCSRLVSVPESRALMFTACITHICIYTGDSFCL